MVRKNREGKNADIDDCSRAKYEAVKDYVRNFTKIKSLLLFVLIEVA